MMYDSLEKLSYAARDSFEEIYQSRFHSICTVHLNFSIHDMPAFYVQVPEVSNLIVNIYKITRDIYRDTQLPQVAMNHFSRRCLIDEIVLTNNIEGVNSTRRDITEVLNSIESQKKRRRFKGLVQKYLLLKENSDIDLSTCTKIRHLYDELVLDEVREENPREVPDGQIFRKDSVEVTSSTQKIIHRGLYPESAIIDGMEKALMFLNDLSIEPLIRISIFHYLIGYIHPFYNGNGRLSRFISSYLLSKEVHPLLGYRLSYTIKEHISEYYQAFKTGNSKRNRGDLTSFLITFLQIVLFAAKQLYTALKKRSDNLRYYSDLLSRLPFVCSDNTRDMLAYLLLQATLFSENGVSTKELLSILNISRNTLLHHLEMFEKNDLLIVSKDKQGDQRPNFYSLNLQKLEELA